MTFFTEPGILNAGRWKNMRIGILGGSFNPPHEGHVHISGIALKSLQLDALWWLVTPLNPLKSNSKNDLLPIEERIFLSKQLNTNPKIIITGMEKDFGTNYSYESIKILKKRFPYTDFAWISGMDNIHNFHLWRNWREILSEICMIHITRQPSLQLVKQCPLRMLATQRHVFLESSSPLPLTPNTSYWLLQNKMLDISSTGIREKQKNIQ